MQYQTQEDNLKKLEVLKTFLSPDNFGIDSNVSKSEVDHVLQEQQIKNKAFETESIKGIAEQLASVIHAVQNPHEEIDYSMLQKRMQKITVLLQEIENENIEELKYINSLLEQLESQEKKN